LIAFITDHNALALQSSPSYASKSLDYSTTIAIHSNYERLLKGKEGNLMPSENLQYVSDGSGTPVAVIVPIALWQEIQSERETAYLLNSEAMKQRLLAAKDRQNGMSLESVCEKLGI
jgi:hypothetical protein